MLIGQHVALMKSSLDPSSMSKDYVGVICTKTRLDVIAQEAIENARFVCQEHYGLFDSPKILLLGAKV